MSKTGDRPAAIFAGQRSDGIPGAMSAIRESTTDYSKDGNRVMGFDDIFRCRLSSPPPPNILLYH